MLSGGSKSSTFIYNGLKNDFNISTVIVEEKPSKNKFIKNRIKKLGYWEVFGQLLFQVSIPKICSFFSKKRIQKIKLRYQLNETPIPFSKVINVKSVNHISCIDLLKREKPDLVIVNGTRIISKKVLNCIDTVFVNTHAGITPKYRGVHGGYWAIANQDKENCGVTVHFVDSGIDTGSILYQQSISPTSKDNFATYTYLQVGEGITLMKKVIEDFLRNDLKESTSQTTGSKLWYHPTIWFYLYKRITKGIK